MINSDKTYTAKIERPAKYASLFLYNNVILYA